LTLLLQTGLQSNQTLFSLICLMRC